MDPVLPTTPSSIDLSTISPKPAAPDNRRFLIIVIFGAILAILIPVTIIILSRNRQTQEIQQQTSQQEGSVASCQAITITDTLNQPLSNEQLSTLRPFDEVKIIINVGTPNISKARFRVNGSIWQEVTIKENGAFIGNYIIPQGPTKFTVEAEVYDSTKGWL